MSERRRVRARWRVGVGCLLVGLLGSGPAASAHADRAAPEPVPTFTGTSPPQEKRFLERVGSAPRPLRRLIERAYPLLTVKLYRGDLGGGNYTATIIDADGIRFTVALSPRSLRAGTPGDHMTLHELGHVIVNKFFNRHDYGGMFELFAASPAWLGCFPSAEPRGEPCVGPDEILADQLAYLGSDPRFRSSYGIPPLALPSELIERLRPIVQREVAR